jgi:hypothetical protein
VGRTELLPKSLPRTSFQGYSGLGRLFYLLILLAIPAGMRENNKNDQLHCQPTLNVVVEIKGFFWEVSNRAPWTLT